MRRVVVFLASLHGIDMFSGRVPLLLVACSALLAACGGSEANEDRSGVEMASINMRSEVTGGRLERRVDINLDGNPDIWEFFDVYDSEGSHVVDEAAIASNANEDLRLVERHVDTNLDIRVDIVRFYDSRQQLERELLDIDFDGILDYTNIYRNGILAERQTDADGNQVPEEVRFYRGGNLARIESDVDGDGRLEFYEYFRDNELTHYGIDRDGDGTVDEWTRRQGAMARASAPGVSSSAGADEGSAAAPAEGSAAAPSGVPGATGSEGSAAPTDAAPQGEMTPEAGVEAGTAEDAVPPTEPAAAEGSAAP